MLDLRSLFSAVLALVPILITAGTARAVLIDATWIGGTGVWNDTANWDVGVVPNNGVDTYNVLVDGGDTGTDSEATINLDVTLDDLEIDQGDVVILDNGRDLTVTGASFVNDGEIRLDSAGGATELRFDAATLTGSGFIGLSTGVSLVGDNSIEGNGVGSTLTVASGAVQIFRTGIGAFGGNGLTVTNQGSIRASDGATVRLTGSDFLVSGGFLRALDLSTFVIGAGARVVGGTLSSDGSGEYRGTGIGSPFGILEGVNLTGQVRLANGEDLVLAGAVINSGDIMLDSTGGSTQLQVSSTTPPSLAGTGTITFSSGVSLIGDNVIEGIGAGSALTIVSGATQTLEGGEGSVGGGSLEITIDGTLEAEGGVTVRFFDVPVANDGTMRVKDASVLLLAAGAVITGGVLETEGTGAFQSGGSAVPLGLLDGVELTGRVELPNSTSLTAAGSITNDGTIALLSTGGATQLRISSVTPTSLAGTGRIEFSDATSSFGDNEVEGSGAGSVLTIQPGATQTLFDGLGSVGGNGLEIDNDGTLVADGGTQARFFDVPVDNGDGEMRVADGSFIQLDGETVVTGGTLVTEGSGVFRGSITGSPFATLDGVSNQGRVELQNGEDLILSGAIVNDGTFAIESIGTTTQLQISGAVSVTGTGAFAMSDAPTPFGDNELEEAAGGGTLTLGSGQTLSGQGSVRVALETAGRIEPGALIGQLNFTEDLTMTGAAVLQVDLAGLMQADEYDLVTLQGASVTLAGSFFPILSESFAGDVTASDVFEVLSVTGGGAISGAFANAPSGGRVLGPGGASFLIEYGAGAPDPTKIVLSDYAKVVPGPASVWEFSGVAQGGSIDFTVSGVPLSVTTTAGQTAAEVAELVADAIRNDPVLFTIPIGANNVGDRVLTDGEVSEVVIDDPGIGHVSIPSVPALPWPALLGLGVAIAVAGARARRRTRDA